MPQSTNSIIRLAMAQINTTVGDLEGNTNKIIEYMKRARQHDVDIVSFPELAITGYPPEGLLSNRDFINRNLECLHRITEASEGITAIVGFVDLEGSIFNAAAVISNQRIYGVYHKSFLSDYGTFDEGAYFQFGAGGEVYNMDGLIFGMGISEDSWYPDGPHMLQGLVGDAQIIFVINSLPFGEMKWRFRDNMLATRASDNACFFVYCNLVGGQDEFIFDGHSVIAGPDGDIVCRGPIFEEALVIADLDVQEVFRRRLMDTKHRREKIMCGSSSQVKIISIPDARKYHEKVELPSHTCNPPEQLEEIYKALKTGLKDYVEKNGFKKVVLGISGGIDSALAATIAVDALGPDRVVGVVMPSMYSSKETQEDAVEISNKLGIQHYLIPIEKVYNSYLETLAEPFTSTTPDVTEENIQARIRGNILMALSNKFRWLVLATGNKSEIAVGYGTLYGDMAGGLSVLKDVPKTLVYKLSDYRNKMSHVIPQSIITRAPSAELKPNQKDQDSLPPYEILDPIIDAYIEEDMGIDDIVRLGFNEETVRRIVRMIDQNEYKRRQAPPGINLTPKAFGKRKRLPITNKFHG